MNIHIIKFMSPIVSIIPVSDVRPIFLENN